MSKPRDVSGQRFGRLVAIERAPYKPGHSKGKAYWLCSCDCGGTHTAQVAKLTTGRCVSCGCWRRELLKAKNVRANEDRKLRRSQAEAKRQQTFKTDEYRELKRKLARNYWRDPSRSGEHREKLHSVMKRLWSGRYFIDKMSASLHKRWSSEEYRNKHSGRMTVFFYEIRSLPHFIENQKLGQRRMYPKKCVLAAGLPLLKVYVDRARILLDEGECMEVAIDALRQEFVVTRRRPTGEKATCR
jgi:hypothetical protein